MKYFFGYTKNGNEGKMCMGWKQMANGELYYFGVDGKMFVNQMTSDGYMVGADGAWIQ